MKKVLFLIFASLLVLGACGQDEDKSNKDEQNQKSDNQNNEDKVKSTNKENLNSQKQSSPEKNNQNIDLSNIQDRNTLESIIYGNYTEEQKVQAYKSAVSNGVIPQGNVMHGPATKAYESSLRIESGQEKSVYDNYSSSNSSSGTDAGMIDYDEVDKQLEENKKAQAEKEAELQKEYFELSDKMFEEDVSDEEYDAMEKRQNEILDEVEPIN
ncbi:hypothetical protein [Staphylococcus epidermidis]|uniref:hypothetical protein n=1 Tax=Staphylococcus epidermidis TaxID=1282 RepID=UPI00024E184A|nr:hypothetical protein [Staphylococcus epidermidis]EHR80362.1 putative lipoprotein [Staphylococcus epidermidis VCU118]